MKQEINFRSTTGYRSDDSADAYVQVSTANNYPTTTPQGNNVGWEFKNDPWVYNTSTTNDVRLGGCVAVGDWSFVSSYRIDLPSAGDYVMRCAAGRQNATRAVDLKIDDGSSFLVKLVSLQMMSANDRFFDATDVERTGANWPSLNQPTSATFSSTILRLRMGGVGIAGDDWVFLAHFSVESAGSPPIGLSPAFLRNYYMNQGWA